jgi:Alpha-acetolactate decarboxylase
MKRIRAQVEITRRPYVEFEADDDLDDEEIQNLAIEEAELAEWEDDLPEVKFFEILPGYHWHFLSHDHQRGGHLLQCRGRQLRLQIQREGTFSIALPETADFLNADLRRDPSADLARAETDQRGQEP